MNISQGQPSDVEKLREEQKEIPKSRKSVDESNEEGKLKGYKK
jgi:hypothetical protein